MKFMFQYFSKIWQENSIFIKICKGWALYRNTSIQLWLYISQFFLEWTFFQTKLVAKIATPILRSVRFPPPSPRKSCHSQDNVKNTVGSDRSARMTIWRMRIACWITTNTDTHSEYVIFIVFPLQQWLQSRSSCYVTPTLSLLFSTMTVVRKTTKFCKSERFVLHNYRVSLLQRCTNQCTYLKSQSALINTCQTLARILFISEFRNRIWTARTPISLPASEIKGFVQQL